ncbi:HK97 gp10 family phage protein [Paenibacillus sp. YYML68]|uniref:HK97 gp10 family phage protein n=1 Tax=Paenibacillus sp. YYML68 TaxID=2909250 RepID=UPI002490749A|nr:HK97 gp10 family phage protein [Paenibacillus sp. YYML68]
MSQMGEFEFEGLKEFQTKLEQLQLAYPKFVESCMKELAGRLLAKVIARTPVGRTGDLRKGWTVGKIQRAGDQIYIEIINPIEYAKYVEFGHRTRDHAGWVEGRFMLTTSEAELQQELPAILERRLQTFMNRYLGG